jgi:hypothetical protein
MTCKVFIDLPKMSEFEIQCGIAQIALDEILKTVKRRGVRIS